MAADRTGIRSESSLTFGGSARNLTISALSSVRRQGVLIHSGSAVKFGLAPFPVRTLGRLHLERVQVVGGLRQGHAGRRSPGAGHLAFPRGGASVERGWQYPLYRGTTDCCQSH